MNVAIRICLSACAGVVVDQVDGAIGALDAVGVGDAGTLVDHQAAVPRVAVVVGEAGDQVRTGFAVRWIVRDQEQLAGREPPDEEARVDVGNLRSAARAPRLPRGRVEKLSPMP